MMRRLGIWTMCGFGIAGVWALVVWALSPQVNVGRWWVVAVTAPASILGHRRPMSWEEFILVNAAMYAGAGAMVEGVRRMRGI